MAKKCSWWILKPGKRKLYCVYEADHQKDGSHHLFGEDRRRKTPKEK